MRGVRGFVTAGLGLTLLYLAISSQGASNRLGTLPTVLGGAARRWIDPVPLFGAAPGPSDVGQRAGDAALAPFQPAAAAKAPAPALASAIPPAITVPAGSAGSI